MNGRLYRSRDERVLAGVAGGLADYFDLDPSLVRIAWVILALFSGGAFLVLYVAMAIVVPEEPWDLGPTGTAPPPGNPPQGGSPEAPGGLAEGATGQVDWRAQREQWHAQRQAWRAQRRAERAAMRARGEGPTTNGGLIFGLLLLALGVFFLLPLVFPGYSVDRLWPIILVGLGLVLVILALRPRGSGR